jgi:hypothetical protein
MKNGKKKIEKVRKKEKRKKKKFNDNYNRTSK